MMVPPSTCRPSSTLATLTEDLVEEILIRISPDEPAHLFRAALVCKPWRRILSDPGFLQRYGAFHRRHPPLLGFFFNDFSQIGCPARFEPSAAAIPSPPANYQHRAWHVLDCHHGRVLFRDKLGENLFVWDPISDALQELRVHQIKCRYFRFAVLCAVAGCDHHDCWGGPFLVVYIGAGATDNAIIVRALVYSSEARAWGTPVSSKLDGIWDLDIYFDRAAVIGDKIYCVFTPGVNIIKYDFVKDCISLFSSWSICSEASHNSLPIVGEYLVLTQNEDGSLGLASIRYLRLYLWSSRMVNHDGKFVVDWVQERVIELDKILPIDLNKHYAQVDVAGFAEGVGILFISTRVGTFGFELKSGQVRKLSESNKVYIAFPLISFLTPLSTTEATGHAATLVDAALKKLYVDSPYIKSDCSWN